MDRIFIHNLSINGKHGVSDAERSAEQVFIIDIEADFDTRAAAKSDVLGDTVNYSRFRDAAKEVVEQNSFFLIERMAQSIAERILEDERIPSVRVTVRKPSVYDDCDPGITIERSRV